MVKGLDKNGNGSRTKFLIDGKSLCRYCREKGLSKSEYARVRWVMNNKGMSPEEALNYHKPPKNPKFKEIKRNQQRVRDYHIEAKFAELPSKFLIEMGYDKQSKYFYGGLRLRKWCEKHKQSYSTIINRMRKHGLTVKQAIETPYLRNEFYSNIRKFCQNNKVKLMNFYGVK